MKRLLRSCLIASLVAVLALPLMATADDDHENYEKDAEQAEGMPPTTPHLIKDTSNGEYCLGCHRTGLKGAPETPHPERLNCTGCHVQGEIKAKKKGKGKK